MIYDLQLFNHNGGGWSWRKEPLTLAELKATLDRLNKLPRVVTAFDMSRETFFNFREECHALYGVDFVPSAELPPGNKIPIHFCDNLPLGDIKECGPGCEYIRRYPGRTVRPGEP